MAIISLGDILDFTQLSHSETKAEFISNVMNKLVCERMQLCEVENFYG